MKVDAVSRSKLKKVKLNICTKIYLSDSDSAFNYAEIDESTAEEYQKEYDKIQEDKINNMNNNIDI